MELLIGAEVLDSAGESLGKVIQESPDWFLVELVGAVRQHRVIMRDEVAIVEPVRLRLRVTQSSMATRPDRPGVPAVTGGKASSVE